MNGVQFLLFFFSFHFIPTEEFSHIKRQKWNITGKNDTETVKKRQKRKKVNNKIQKSFLSTCLTTQLFMTFADIPCMGSYSQRKE